MIQNRYNLGTFAARSSIFGFTVAALFLIALTHPLLVHAAACAAPTTNYGSVTSTVSIGTTGSYRVWSRIMSGTTSSDNSYSLEIDGTTCYVVGDYASMTAGSWQWVNYQNGSTTSPIDVTLSAGSHTIKMIGRESGVELDRIVMTTDTSCVPTGTGDNCANPADTVAPKAAITSPTTGSIVNGTVTINATASDDSGVVSKTELWVDNALNGAADTTAPYTFNWDSTKVANGTHSIVVKAYDPSKNVGSSSSVSLTVSNSDTTAPSVPTGLSTTVKAYNSVALAWSASTDNTAVAGYKIYRNGTQIGTATGTTWTDNTAAASTTYGYQVSAYDAASNNSALSATVNATTPVAPDTTAPSVPTGLTTTVKAYNAVALAWSASTDNTAVAGYKIYRNGTQIGTATGTTWTDNTAAASTTYGYQVSAYDAASNNSALSATVNATTPVAPDTTPPATPTSVTATASSYNSVTVKWAASSDNVAVAGYYVVRNGVTIATVNSSALSYGDSSVSAASTYQYQVMAFDTSNLTSSLSSVVSVTTPAVPDTIAPSMPGNISATAASTSQINLTWVISTDNVGVTKYTVTRSSTGSASVSFTVSGSATSFGDTGLAASTAYSYSVVASDAAGNQSSPAAASATTQATPPSATFGNLQGTIFSNTGNSLSGSLVSLSYNGTTHSYSSDSTGAYYIGNIPAQFYSSVKFSHKGYRSNAISVTIQSGQTLTQNATLSKNGKK